jgi:hypothetical protein
MKGRDPGELTGSFPEAERAVLPCSGLPSMLTEVLKVPRAVC